MSRSLVLTSGRTDVAITLGSTQYAIPEVPFYYSNTGTTPRDGPWVPSFQNLVGPLNPFSTLSYKGEWDTYTNVAVADLTGDTHPDLLYADARQIYGVQNVPSFVKNVVSVVNQPVYSKDDTDVLVGYGCACQKASCASSLDYPFWCRGSDAGLVVASVATGRLFGSEKKVTMMMVVW